MHRLSLTALIYLRIVHSRSRTLMNYNSIFMEIALHHDQ